MTSMFGIQTTITGDEPIRLTPEQIIKARKTICHFADNADEAAEFMSALGINPIPKVPKEKPQRTHCRSGRHLFTEENTYVVPGRSRTCKQCHKERRAGRK